KRKVGDYATAAAAVVLTLSGGKVATCSIGLTNVAETPLWAEEAGKILTGSTIDAATLKRAVAAAEAITSPASDGRGPSAYRTKMAGVTLTRALARAKTRVGTRPSGENNDEIPGFYDRERQESGGTGRTPHTAHPFPARTAAPHRSPYRLRHQPLRRVHGRSRRQVGEILHSVRSAGEWCRNPHHRRHGCSGGQATHAGRTFP